MIKSKYFIDDETGVTYYYYIAQRQNPHDDIPIGEFYLIKTTAIGGIRKSYNIRLTANKIKRYKDVLENLLERHKRDLQILTTMDGKKMRFLDKLLNKTSLIYVERTGLNGAYRRYHVEWCKDYSGYILKTKYYDRYDNVISITTSQLNHNFYDDSTREVFKELQYKYERSIDILTEKQKKELEFIKSLPSRDIYCDWVEDCGESRDLYRIKTEDVLSATGFYLERTTLKCKYHGVDVKLMNQDDAYKARIYINPDNIKIYMPILERLEVDYDRHQNTLSDKQKYERHYIKTLIPNNNYPKYDNIISDPFYIGECPCTYQLDRFYDLSTNDYTYRLVQEFKSETIYKMFSIALNDINIKKYDHALKNLLSKYTEKNFKNELTHDQQKYLLKLLELNDYIAPIEHLSEKIKDKMIRTNWVKNEQDNLYYSYCVSNASEIVNILSKGMDISGCSLEQITTRDPLRSCCHRHTRLIKLTGENINKYKSVIYKLMTLYKQNESELSETDKIKKMIIGKAFIIASRCSNQSDNNVIIKVPEGTNVEIEYTKK